MKNRLILLTFILMMSSINVLSDIRPLPERPFASPAPTSPPPVTPQSPPVIVQTPPAAEEATKAGFCYAPTIIAGLLISLSIMSFGWRFIRNGQMYPRVKSAIN